MSIMSGIKATHAFAVPGQSNIIDLAHPVTELSFYTGETLEQIRRSYPGAELVNFAEWMQAKAASQDTPIEWTETTEEQYWEMLECLPPAAMMGGGFLVGEPQDHHATNGQPRFSAYIKRSGKYLTASRPMTREEFIALYKHKSALSEAQAEAGR